LLQNIWSKCIFPMLNINVRVWLYNIWHLLSCSSLTWFYDQLKWQVHYFEISTNAVRTSVITYNGIFTVGISPNVNIKNGIIAYGISKNGINRGYSKTETEIVQMVLEQLY